MKRFKITKDGYQKLKNELDNYVNVERPAIAKAIASARDLGDLSENEEYATAKDKQKYIEAMIASLHEKLANAEVVDIANSKSDVVDFGAKVTLLDLNTDKEINYQLLSEYESDLSKGIIAVESLVGRSLLGKKIGDEVQIKTPSGLKEYEILNIKY